MAEERVVSDGPAPARTHRQGCGGLPARQAVTLRRADDRDHACTPNSFKLVAELSEALERVREDAKVYRERAGHLETQLDQLRTQLDTALTEKRTAQDEARQQFQDHNRKK